MSLNLRHKTAAQLQKMICRGFPPHVSAASYEWAERIERGPVRSCLTKKKQRQLGMLPQVHEMQKRT